MKRPGGAAHAEGESGRAYLFVLFSSLAFASMGAFGHLAGERCDWHLVAAARSAVAFVLTLTLSLLSGVRLALFRPRVLWMRSVAGSLGVLFAFYALTHMPVSTSVTLSNTVPVWVTLLAWPVLGHRPRASVWVAVVLGLVGIVLIQRPEAGGHRLAAAMALANALSTSVSMIGLNRLSGVDARAVVTHFSGVATALTVAFMFASGGVDVGALKDATTLAFLFGVGLCATVAQLAMTKAYALGNPSRVSVVGLMQVVFALAFDLLFWRRQFGPPVVLGIALVVAPSAWLMLRSPLRRQPAAVHTTTS
jgi:drug/metabolite transporter (DMT)-like permease